MQPIVFVKEHYLCRKISFTNLVILQVVEIGGA